MLALLSTVAWAETPVELTGSVATQERLALRTCLESSTCPFLDFHDAVVLRPVLIARPGTKVTVKGDVALRVHGPTGVEELPDEGDAQKTVPLSVRVHDLWVGGEGEWVDARFGVQRIAWGTADGMSVADRVNPWDLEDPTRFDRRLSTPSASLIVHQGGLALEGVVAPWFVPAALPTDEIDFLAGARDLFDPADYGLETSDLEVGELASRMTVPSSTLDNGTYAARLAWTHPVVDAALSWTHGRDSLPQVGGEVLLTGFQTADRVDVGIPMIFPRIDVGALEVRGEVVPGTSGWAELAVVLPAETLAMASATQLQALENLDTIDEVPDPLPRTVTQDGRPYWNAIVGADRALGPVYVNAQWLHGFPTERTRDELSDYGFLLVRWSMTSTWVFAVRGGVSTEGGLGGATLSHLWNDSLEARLFGTWIEGANGSTLVGFEGVSHVGLGAEASF